ncbi:unnamed protein product [Schistosoma margrebowiei]|uniref:Uncharacterized protein n=1 Tax=Schistosoma margrebowiei TaxID=48269 RepID=A0A183LZS0_9TREM|nr:unnamed protein product [Schistosoma margrebowiei]
MKTSTCGRKRGIQWSARTQLDDIDFIDDLVLLSRTQQQMQEKTTSVSAASAADDPGFVESECKRRKPHPKFKEYLECEKSILKLGKKHKKKFVTYVLACGVFYGCGEYLFRHLFKIVIRLYSNIHEYLYENVKPIKAIWVNNQNEIE